MKSGDDLSLEIAGDYISPKLTPVSGYIEFSYGYGFTGRNASYKSRKLFFNNFLNDAYISRTDYDPEGGDLTLKIPTYLNMPETVDVEVFTKESSGHAPLTTHENVEVTAVHGRAVHRRSFLTFNVGRSVGIDIAVLMGIFFEDENKQLLKNDVVLIGDEDSDGDGIEDWLDNCPFVANPQQQNSDIISYNGLTYSDGFGDACDDSDDDGYLHNDDNCPNTTNPNQDDFDGDELGDVCDYDDDDDGVLDTLDICPFTNSWNKEKVISVDAILDACGPNALNNVNCPNFYYRHAVDYQGCYDEDTDGVPYEDWYDSDDDGSFDNSLQIDNCPDVHNPLQFDWNEDGVGFACDADGRAAYQHYRDAEASYYEQQGQRSPQDQEYGQGGQGGSDYNDSDSQETDDGEFVFDGNPDTNGGQAGGWDDQAFELQLESDKEGGGFGLDLPDKEGFGFNLESDVKLEWGRSY